MGPSTVITTPTGSRDKMLRREDYLVREREREVHQEREVLYKRERERGQVLQNRVKSFERERRPSGQLDSLGTWIGRLELM